MNDSGNDKKRYHHGDLKQALLQATFDILQRDGMKALSLRAIAAETGVSHMAPYAHFKNKKELFQAAALAGFDLLADAMELDGNALQDKDTRHRSDRVLAYGAAYLTFATEHQELYRLMLSEMDRQADNQVLLDSRRRPFALLREAINDAYGPDVDSKIQALGAWSIVHGMAALLIDGHIQVPPNLTIKQFLAAATPQLRL